MGACHTAAMELATDRGFRFPVDAGAFWSAISDIERYRAWWPWLTSFDGRGLATGDVWQCTVRPQVPYLVRFVVHLDEVEPCRRIVATVDGDIRGRAELMVRPTAGGCEVTLQSRLAPRARGLRALAMLAPPVVRRGHDWILDAGARQFAGRALAA